MELDLVIIWGILHACAMCIHRIYSWVITPLKKNLEQKALQKQILHLQTMKNKGINHADALNDSYCTHTALLKQKTFFDSITYKILCWFITFNFINISWVFFRAENIQGAINLLAGMFGVVWIDFPHKARLIPHFLAGIQGKNETVIYLVCAFIVCLYAKNSIEKLQSFKPNFFFLIATMMLFYISIITMAIQPYSEFLYCNF